MLNISNPNYQIANSKLSYDNGKIYSLTKTANFFTLILQAPFLKSLKNFYPGQFIQIKPEKYFYPLFMRPFSIYKVEEKIIKNKKQLLITIIFKVVGAATNNLTKLKTGDKIFFIAPLGNGFNTYNVKNTFIVAGGIGFVPLVPLIKKIKEKDLKANIYFFYGAKTKNEIINLKEIKKYSKEIFITTEDGSLGKKGLITDLLKTFLAKNTDNEFKIFSCGPKAMLKTIQQISLQKNIPAEISLEEKMICGYGVCLGCVVKNNKNKFLKCCTDGAVFKAEEINFNV